MWKALLDDRAPDRATDEAGWRRQHRLLLRVLAAHLPAIVAIGFVLGRPVAATLISLAVPAALLGLGLVAGARPRGAAVAVAAGLACCSALLVGLTGQEAARVHLLVVVGLVALYRSAAPILAVVAVAVLGHGLSPVIGAAWPGTPPFADPATLADPWLWALVHGTAVVLLGAVVTAQVRRAGAEAGGERDQLARRLTEVELGRRHFVAELLVNLARRAQSLVYRQLEILGTLQEAEYDPDRLAELGTLDNLATRVRRNAENLLVLAGEQATRPATGPVPVRTVIEAAITETENPARVRPEVDDPHAVAGHAVADLTQLLAELIENALRFSPPDTVVRIRSGPDPRGGGRLLTVEDEGVGMPSAVLADANAIFAEPREVDLSVSQRLGLHVVARLAQRHGIIVTVTPGAIAGVVCTIGLPTVLWEVVADGEHSGTAVDATLDEATTAIPVDAEPADPDPITAAIPLPHPEPGIGDRVAPLPRPAPPGDTEPAAEPNPAASPPQLPVRIPAQGSVLGATAPFAAVPGTRRDTRQPAVFGSTDAWTGWWNSAVDRSSLFAATAPNSAPTTTGRRPAGHEHPIPAPRSQPPAAAPPGPRRAEPAAVEPDPAGDRAAPIAWVDPLPGPGPDQEPDPAAPELIKRVPQASLAPPLRIPPPGHTPEAPTALSRYQAGRAEHGRPPGVDTPTAAAEVAESLDDGYDPGHTDESDGVDSHSVDSYSEHDPEHPADDRTLDPAGADRSTPTDTAQDTAQDTARRPAQATAEAAPDPQPPEEHATIGRAPGEGRINDQTVDEPTGADPATGWTGGPE